MLTEADYEWGITRQGSTFRCVTYRSADSPRTTVGAALRDLPADDFVARLAALVDTLNTNNGLRMYKKAYRDNMIFKMHRYAELQRDAEEEARRQVDVIDLKTAELKRLARVADDSDNWNIFESISEQYREAKDRAASFEAVRLRAAQCLEGSMSVDELRAQDRVRALRDELTRALQQLTSFAAQAHVVTKAVDIVGSFIKDPRLFRSKPMNFMLVGAAGSGKTTLASAIGDVFAKAGIFVGDRLVTAGRAELVGQYEGQTVARTRSFLVSNLDAGVVFIDEAYAITPWQNGKPEGYGSEAATAMVEFMTRYQGLYCLIVAGYEQQMTRYFLPCNEGLSRRFPYKFVLANASSEYLVRVFRRQILSQQGLSVPDGHDTELESEKYFTTEAWAYLSANVRESVKGQTFVTNEFDSATNKTYNKVKIFVPDYECMYSVFENQSGSMAALAEEAVTALLKHVPFSEIVHKRHGAHHARPRTHDVATMRSIISRRIAHVSLSSYEQFFDEFLALEEAIRSRFE